MPPFASLSGARSALRSGAVSPIEVLAACRDRIEQSEAGVRAWRACDPALARRGAEGVDAAQRAELPLWGIPIGIKDMIDAAGMATMGGSSSASGVTTVAASASETPKRCASALRERAGASPRARSAASSAGTRT